MLSHDDKVRIARTANSEELWNLIRDSSPDIIMNTIFNEGLSEDMAVFVARKKNISPEILGILASDSRFKGSYKLKLAICNNPKTPLKTVMYLLKFLRIFDLGDITKNNNIPINIRQKIEYSILEKIASLPSGVKVALARRSGINIITSLLEKGDKKVVNSCLESPLLTEDNLCRLINTQAAKSILIKTLTEHSKWSLRYRIRYALVKNYHTPMTYVTEFIGSLKTADLRELYSDKSLPSSTRPYIFNELTARDKSVEIPHEETYDLSENDDTDFIYNDI